MLVSAGSSKMAATSLWAVTFDCREVVPLRHSGRLSWIEPRGDVAGRLLGRPSGPTMTNVSSTEPW